MSRVNGQNKIVKKGLGAFSLVEMLVAMGIFTMIFTMTTAVVVRLVQMKRAADTRAEVADTLQNGLSMMKNHLLQSYIDEVDCGETEDTVCDLCIHSAPGACEGAAYEFWLDSNEGVLMKKLGENGTPTAITSAAIDVTDVTFNQVDNYVFIMIKGRDEGGKVIEEGTEVIVQSGVIIRN